MRRYRLVLILASVGALLCIFAFQAIADGKATDALESGIAGVAVLIGAYVVARRTIFRHEGPLLRTKRKWVDDDELVAAPAVRQKRR